MKKFFSLLIAILLILPTNNICYAGERIGLLNSMDIVTYINNMPIASYNFNGKTLIVVDDLVDYGFDVKWNEYDYSITVKRNKSKNTINKLPLLIYDLEPWAIYMAMSSDVAVYIGNKKINSYSAATYNVEEGYYTLIDVEDLAQIDNVKVKWHPEERAVKVWLEDGLEMYSRPIRPVPQGIYYDSYDISEYQEYWNCTANDNLLVLNCYLKTNTGFYVNNDLCYLTITDVIDADGNSVLKPANSVVSTKNRKVKGMSTLSYRLGLSDAPLSVSVFLDKDDLYPSKAIKKGGIIKFEIRYRTYYDSNGRFQYGEAIKSDSVKVDTLPYGNVPTDSLYHRTRKILKGTTFAHEHFINENLVVGVRNGAGTYIPNLYYSNYGLLNKNGKVGNAYVPYIKLYNY